MNSSSFQKRLTTVFHRYHKLSSGIHHFIILSLGLINQHCSFNVITDQYLIQFTCQGNFNPKLVWEYFYFHYTLSVKRNLSERHSLQSKASNRIIFGHRLAIILNILSTSKKSKACLNQKGEKCSEIARGHFTKLQKLLASRAGSSLADKSRYGNYITNWMNSHWMFWI